MTDGGFLNLALKAEAHILGVSFHASLLFFYVKVNQQHCFDQELLKIIEQGITSKC